MQDGGELRDMGRRWFDRCFNRYTIDGVCSRNFTIQYVGETMASDFHWQCCMCIFGHFGHATNITFQVRG